MSLPEAIKTLTQALREDPSYRIGWQANIAMAFQDEFARQEPNAFEDLDIHTISNKAADNFLNLLCYVSKE